MDIILIYLWELAPTSHASVLPPLPLRSALLPFDAGRSYDFSIYLQKPRGHNYILLCAAAGQRGSAG